MSPRQQKACRDTRIFIVSISVKSRIPARRAIVPPVPMWPRVFVQKLLEYENIDEKVAFATSYKKSGDYIFIVIPPMMVAPLPAHIPFEISPMGGRLRADDISTRSV